MNCKTENFSLGQALSSSLSLLSAWIESARTKFELPGMVAGLILDNKLSWWKDFGYSNLEKKTSFADNTLFRIASISKIFTSTAILQLRDKGLLDLDAPVAEYLSWFHVKQRFSTKRQVTVRNLLTHTAGLRREAGTPCWNDYDNFPSTDQLKKKIADLETAFPPDVSFKYSNLGIALAGEIVSAVSKEPYEIFLQKNIFKPLALLNTSVFPEDSEKSGLASGYFRKEMELPRKSTPFMDCRSIVPAANLASTISDLASFFSFHFTDPTDTILSLESRQEMQRVHWLNCDWLSGRGLGFAIRRIKGITIVGHEGWVMGYRSHACYVPDENFGFIIFINADDIAPAYFYERAIDWLTPNIRKYHAEKTNPALIIDYKKYLGKFRNSWGDTEILMQNGKLYYIYISDPDPSLTMIQLVQESEGTFRLDARDMSPPIGEQVVFEFDRNDKIEKVKIGDTYTFPLK